MCCQIHNTFSSSSNGLSIAKDIALVVLSATAIIFGYIQHRRLVRSEWIKGLRTEIAKLNSVASRISVNEVDFRKETTESIGMITLFLDEDNQLHSTLLSDIKSLETLWLDHRFGRRREENILDFVSNVNSSAKAVIKVEQKKFF